MDYVSGNKDPQIPGNGGCVGEVGHVTSHKRNF